MIDAQTVAAIIFILALALFLFLERKKLALQKIAFPLLYFLMYRSKNGLSVMDSFAKRFERPIKWAAYAGIVIGFLGMGLIAYALIENLIKLLFVPATVPGVQLVLPVRAKGVFYVPFFYWILAIIAIAMLHEFSHGIVARAYKMKIKSAGFAFLCLLIPILPAAFVEPDEKELGKRSAKEQLSVFGAGPFSNILSGFVALAIFLLVAVPVADSFLAVKGIEVTGFVGKDMPAQAAGMKANELIVSINGIPINDTQEFMNVLKSMKPGQTVKVNTNASSYKVTLGKNPQNESLAFMGIYVDAKTELKPEIVHELGTVIPNTLLWIFGFLYWFWFLSLGIGLFNLLPLGPVDGGRMTLTLLKHYFEDKRAKIYWKWISFVFLGLLLAIFFFSFLK